MSTLEGKSGKVAKSLC